MPAQLGILDRQMLCKSRERQAVSIIFGNINYTDFTVAHLSNESKKLAKESSFLLVDGIINMAYFTT